MPDTVKKPLALSLMGPTASGKTSLALRLVDHFPQLELISVDSSLVYRGMDIGAAKPERAVLEKYPHRLVDIRNIDQPYSASDFREDALREMEILSEESVVVRYVPAILKQAKVEQGGKGCGE